MATVWERALDLLLPPRCAGCGVSGTPLCLTCAAAAEPYPASQTNAVVAALVFTGATRACIHALKYDGQRRYAVILATLAYPAFAWMPPSDVLVPVPLAAKRERERGFNQSALIAVALGGRAGSLVETRWLTRIRETPPQVGQDRAARQANVAGAFVAHPMVRQRHVCLIDDVMTTGATLDACAAALWAAGAASVRSFVIARPK